MSSRSTRRGRLPVFTVVAALLTTTTTAIGVAAPAHAEPPTAEPTAPPAAPPVQTAEQPPEKPAPAAPTADMAKPIAAAIAEARKTGRTVPIPSLTDEFSTTMASPDGSFATTYSVTPERVARGGKWTPIDTTLVKQKDGSFAPKAAAADVSFGGGGDTTLVSLKQGTNALKFSWTGKLPEPVVTGDTATYANVLPEVDLQVTANATGYSSIFVVKTPAAAANPKVQQLDLGLAGTRVKVAPTGDGGAEATDTTTGRTVFQANTALMWDSTPSSDAPAERATMSRALRSPKAAHEAAALMGRNRARVKVGFGNGKQSLILDKALLTAKTTKYPVFVDPDWGVKFYGNQSSWARISSNGWNVYNSTATTGSNSARIGLDDWPGGAGEKARTYYKMNISGIKGATVKYAYLYVKHRWSASCSKTNAVVYATGAPAGFSSSTLSWGKEPARGALLNTQAGQELNCGTASPSASPGSFTFDVSGNVTTLVKGKKDHAYFLVEAKDMNDKYSWKQLGYKGGASLTVHYSYPPTLNANDGKQHVFPSITDGGKVITTSRTPTLSWRAANRFPNGYERNLMIDYHVEQKDTGKLVAYGYGPGSTTYNKNGSDWRVSTALPDGEYRWRVTAKNQDGLWAPAWGPYMYFTVDASAPNPPTIKSPHFPPNQVGARFSDQGRFDFGNDRKNNVMGYLFTLDGDLNTVTYAGNKGTQWAPDTAIKPGTIYYAKADNGNGTGTVVTNGLAAVVFSPRTAGAHKVVAKAVDAAGSTSGQTVYEFNAGVNTPAYATGWYMINGYNSANADGTVTTVPRTTFTSAGGVLTAQPQFSGYLFADGYQAMLGNNAATGTKVAVGDTMTFSFNVPQIGIWEIGASLMTASDYGTYSLTLDQGRSTQATLTTADFDAYGTPNGPVYRNFGTPKDANGAPIVLDKGVHTITLKVTGKNASSGGYQAGIDMFRLGMTVTCPINDTKACLNNKAISTWQPGATPAVTDADADGHGNSLNAGNLRDAGWAPGATVNVHGAAVKLPATWGDGKNDSMLSAGQLVTVPGSGVVNKGNAVVFLGFAVNGDVRSASGRITYAKNSGCNVASQAYTIDWVVDWAFVPAGNTVLTLPWRNRTADGTAYSGISASIMAFSIPLVCPGAAVSSVSLPLVSGTVEGKVNALHILGLGIRPTSRTADGARWVGSWSAAQDTGAVQTTAAGNATLNAQTVRIPARLSIGADPGRVRVRLANSQGKTPVTFDAASIALQDPGTGGATATDTPVPLTFNGASGITLPAGTDLLSDPVELPAADQATVLVSIKVRGTPTALAGHLDARTPVYVSASDGADHTRDTDGAGFTRSTMTGLPFLAGVDVGTPADRPAGALVLYGDQTVNSDTAGGDGLGQLSDQLTTALSTDEYDNRYPIRAGVLNQGSSSWGNKVLLPRVANTLYPQNSYGLVDREILNQTNARIVLISAGSSDLLTCTDTAANCASTVTTKLNTLAGQLQQYRADDALNFAIDVPTTSRTLKVYVATLPPFTGTYTAAQESARQLVNAHILGSGGPANMGGYADGVIDFAAAVSADGTATGATVKAEDLSTDGTGKSVPNDLYYRDLARQHVLDADRVDGIAGDGEVTGGDYTFPIAEWKLGEGAGTTAADTGTGTGNPADPQYHDAPLTNVTWSAGRQVDRKAATFNGSSSSADTKLALNTAKSFTVSAWVRLADKSADRTVFLRDASWYSSLYFQYQKSSDRWLAQMPSATSGDSIQWFSAVSNETPKVGVWTHLTVVYDASDSGLQLYVNGKAEGRADEVTSFSDPDGASWIGRGRSTWFAGDIAEVRMWLRALEDAEVDGEAAPKMPTVSWQFEDQSLPTTATDSAGRDPEAPGAFTGGVTWKAEGHPNPDGNSGGIDVDRGSIALNGTDAAVSTRARLRTDQSFTVAGWARLTDNTKSATVVSQAGAHSSGLAIDFSADCKCWRFVLPTTDGSANPVATTVAGTSPATLNAWTHLTGVYDAVSGTATLYVNGTAAGSQPVPVPTWNAGGQFVVGRLWWNDAFRNYFKGDIDDVSTYQEALGVDNINNLMRKEAPQG